LNGNAYESALQAEKGAYVAMKPEGKPDVVLVASGSEVATLTAGAEKLKADGIKVQIVSAPSEGLFRNQSQEYQESVSAGREFLVLDLPQDYPIHCRGLSVKMEEYGVCLRSVILHLFRYWMKN
jgi:transketolase